MHVLKYNGNQLSIFDFEKGRATRQRFVSELRSILNLEDENNSKKMLETCCAHSHMFSVEQRHFIFDISILFFEDKSLSEKQVRYLSSLYRKCVKPKG